MSMIPNKLDSEKVWKVAAIVLYDNEANEMIRRNYLDFSIEISTELVSNFIKTLENFAKHQFDEDVYEIHLGSYRILFEECGGYVLTAIVEPGAAVDTGRISPMSRAIRQLLNRVGEVLNLEHEDLFQTTSIDIGFIDKMVSTINSTADNPDSVFHNIQNFESTDKFYVTSVIITDNFGKPWVSRTYEDGVYTEDPLLVSSLISAISQFALQITSLPFKEIVLGKYRIFLKSTADRIYVITIELDNPDVVLNHKSKVSEYIAKLNESLVESTSFLDDQERTSDAITVNHHTLTAIVDALVIKSIQGTIGHKQIDRSKLDDVELYHQKPSPSRASAEHEQITDQEEYSKAKGLLSRVRDFFRS